MDNVVSAVIGCWNYSRIQPATARLSIFENFYRHEPPHHNFKPVIVIP